jgi:hypothetical protein
MGTRGLRRLSFTLIEVELDCTRLSSVALFVVDNTPFVVQNVINPKGGRWQQP